MIVKKVACEWPKGATQTKEECLLMQPLQLPALSLQAL